MDEDGVTHEYYSMRTDVFYSYNWYETEPGKFIAVCEEAEEFSDGSVPFFGHVYKECELDEIRYAMHFKLCSNF